MDCLTPHPSAQNAKWTCPVASSHRYRIRFHPETSFSPPRSGFPTLRAGPRECGIRDHSAGSRNGNPPYAGPEGCEPYMAPLCHFRAKTRRTIPTISPPIRTGTTPPGCLTFLKCRPPGQEGHTGQSGTGNVVRTFHVGPSASHLHGIRTKI